MIIKRGMHSEPMLKTDFELIRYNFVDRYGKDILASRKKVYVKERMTHKKDEIIYEWGKSLIDFRTVESIKKQSASVRVMGWNPMKEEGFSSKKSIEDVSQKVGGKSPWTKVAKDGKNWVDNIYDMDIADSKEAEELALGRLRQMSFKYLRAEGSGEGNSKLSAGMEVTVKYVGKAASGDYIAEAVIHDFSLESGYITEFRLKRNMLDDEFVQHQQRMSGRSSGQGYGPNRSVETSQTEEEQDEEEEDEEGPEFRGLVWKKEGKTISEALVDDDVMMCFEVKNIDDGETVNVTIWEHDADGEHDEIKKMSGEVKDGRVEIPWKVEYHADDDDSNCAEEIEKYGFTVPEYFFVAEYGGVESKEEPPKLLNAKGWVRRQLKEEETGEIWANRKYILVLPDNSRIEGETNENGYVEPAHSPFGDVNFIIYKKGKKQ